MPTGTPFKSYINPYRIRVDEFANDPDSSPLLHLLTHTHTDHINGLSAKSFGYQVYCSQDAKEMLLKHENYAERELQMRELRTEKRRTYSHLKVNPCQDVDGTVYYQGSRDLLHALPLNTPTDVDLTGEETVTITLLDANHCPGAVMFLIEGKKGAVLHTGDFRAEPHFLEIIKRHPLLQPYLASEDSDGSDYDRKPNLFAVNKTLDTIFLDTANVLSMHDTPTKRSATDGLIKLMKLMPDDVYFFLNCWTWGYEDILKAVAGAFNSQIHVDRYKQAIYHRIKDPRMVQITTTNESVRFHACERFLRCSTVAVDDDLQHTNSTSHKGHRVVYVNPVNMSIDQWDVYFHDTATRLQAKEKINNLLVPLARHSPLPELQEFVKLFRPKKVVPNTLDPRLMNLDWAYIDRQFAPFLHHSTKNAPMPIRERLAVTRNNRLDSVAQDDVDVAFKNLVGDGAALVANRWADQGKLIKKMALLKESLDDDDQRIIDELCGLVPPNAGTDKGKGVDTSLRDANDSDCESYDSGAAHDGIANFFWVGSDDKENYSRWAPSSPLVMEAEGLGKDTERVSPTKKRHTPGGTSAHRINRLTPESSPLRPRKPRPIKTKPVLPTVPATPPKQHPAHRTLPTAQRSDHAPGRSQESPIVLLSSPAPLPAMTHRKSLSHVFPTTKSTTPDVPASDAMPLKAKMAVLTPVSSFTNAVASSSKLPDLQKSSRRASKPPPIPSAAPKPMKRLASEAIPDSSRPQKKGKTTASFTLDHSHLSQDPGSVSQMLRSTESPLLAKKQSKRMHCSNVSAKLAKAYPGMVKPSYSERSLQRLSQIGHRSQSDDIITKSSTAHSSQLTQALSSHHDDPLTRPSFRTKPLQPAKTLPCFDDDDNKTVDWNRSGMLAEAVRSDVKHGRVPSLPSLECLGTDSQSPVMK